MSWNWSKFRMDNIVFRDTKDYREGYEDAISEFIEKIDYALEDQRIVELALTIKKIKEEYEERIK